MEAAIVANREDARIGLVITASPVVSAPKAALRTIGVISHEAALGHFAFSDALLFTSSRESLGLPLLEALHFGLPAVLPSLPYARAIYGDAGAYFESDEVAAVAAAMLACVRGREALSEKVSVRREHVRSGGVTWAEHWKKIGLL